MLGTASAELRDRAWLGRMGVRVCLLGHQPFMAAIKTVHDTLKAIRDGASPDTLPGVAPKELMDRVTRDADYRRWMGEYLGGGGTAPPRSEEPTSELQSLMRIYTDL